MAAKNVSVGAMTYAWIESWAQLPDSEARRSAMPHTAIVAADDGDLIGFDSAERALLTLHPDGTLLHSVPVDIDEAHGLTYVSDGGVPYLWLADASVGRHPDTGYERNPGTTNSNVVKVGLDARTAMSLVRPPHPAYATGKYRPTCVAVYEERFGGNGEIWVADGYGESYVHHFDRSGNYLGSLSGEQGGGRFQTPHALFVDRRRGEPELYIADRGNARIQVYGMDGHFRRLIEGFLHRPTWMVAAGDLLILVEFTPPRVTILDGKDRLVGYLAEGPVILDRPGWPNELDAAGKPKRPSLEPGILNSPHSIAADAEGNLYLSEYMIGGRMPKLQKMPTA